MFIVYTVNGPLEGTITNLSPCPRLADIVLHCILTSRHCIVVHYNTMYSDQKTLSYVVFQHRHCNTYNILQIFDSQALSYIVFRLTDIVIQRHCMLYCIVLHFITLYYIVFRHCNITTKQKC